MSYREHSRFDGTVFRFPLRLPEHNSELKDSSESTYAPSKVLGIFEGMKKDGHLFLLFLKSVESIELYHR